MAVVQCNDMKKYKTLGDLAADYYIYVVLCFTLANTVAAIVIDTTATTQSSQQKENAFNSVFNSQSISGNRGQNYTRLEKVSFGTYLLRIARNNPFVQPGHTLYGAVIFGNLRVVKVFSEQIVTDFPELYSSQEEADTRMMLQALHADKNLKEMGKKDQIIIKTFDTDVIVLCIDFFPRMTNTTELWVQMRNVRNVKNGRRFFPIYHLCASLLTAPAKL